MVTLEETQIIQEDIIMQLYYFLHSYIVDVHTSSYVHHRTNCSQTIDLQGPLHVINILLYLCCTGSTFQWKSG